LFAIIFVANFILGKEGGLVCLSLLYSCGEFVIGLYATKPGRK